MVLTTTAGPTGSAAWFLARALAGVGLLAAGLPPLTGWPLVSVGLRASVEPPTTSALGAGA